MADAVELGRDGLDFEPSQLDAFLVHELPHEARQLTVERISGGQSNPTYFVTYGTRRMVLRKKPAGPILQGAHAIEREFRILKALSSTDVPVPKPLLLVEDSDILGTPFYLMERVGCFPIVPWQSFPATNERPFSWRWPKLLLRFIALGQTKLGFPTMDARAIILSVKLPAGRANGSNRLARLFLIWIA